MTQPFLQPFYVSYVNGDNQEIDEELKKLMPENSSLSLERVPIPGPNASLKLVSNRFVWPNMNKNCRDCARACPGCQRSKIT